MPETAAQTDDLGLIPAEVQHDPGEDLGLIPADAPKLEPDMASMKAHFEEALKKPKEDGTQRQAEGIWDAIVAGWQGSAGVGVKRLMTGEGRPEVILPENAPMASQIASGLSGFVGDVPAMIPGFFAGAAAGTSVVPGPGTAVGAAAGAMAFPAAIRKALMDHYEKGDIKDAHDFVARSMSALWEGSKQGVVGGLTGGAGLVAGKVVTPIAGSLTARLAPTVAEIATMTTAGAAIEGHLPNAEDFTVAGLMVATIHGLTKVGVGGSKHVSQKMRKIYAETGIRPEQVVEDAKQNPVLQQELLTDNNEVPKAYKPLAEQSLDIKSSGEISEVTGKSPKRADLNDDTPIYRGHRPKTEGSYWTLNPEQAKGYAGTDGELFQSRLGNVPKDVFNNEFGDQLSYQQHFETTDVVAGPSLRNLPIEKKYTQKSVSMAEVVNEPAPEIKPDHPAVKTILENVEDAPKPAKEGYSFSKAYTDFIDRLNPIKEAVDVLTGGKKNLSVEENPYQLARMANDFKAKVKHFVERGTIDFKTLQVNGKGLNEIVAPFKENLREFEAFLISKRAMDYEKRGLSAGFDMAAAKEVIKMGEKKYGAAAKELVEFQRRTLQYALDAGLINEKSYNSMIKAGEGYIPLKRLLEPGQFENVRTKGGALKRVKGVEEGADIKTKSPMLSILENTESLMRLAEKNRAVESFVKMAEGDPAVIEKVQAKSRPIEISEAEVRKFFDEHGIEGDAESFNIFRPNQLKLAENEFEVIRNGKREVFRTTKELAEAFHALDGDATSMNIGMKIARAVTTLKRIGITLTPEFITRNFLRDQMMSAATSKGHVLPFVDVVVAIGDLVKKNDHYYNWLKAGGAQGAFLELNDRYLMKDVFKLEKSTGMLESTWNVIRSPVDALLAGAHIVELAPRLAEFKKVSKGAASGKGVFEGGFASREVTLDFQRMGAKMSAWNAITAFTNATVQGADKAARALKENPGEVALKAGIYITTPSILLWWANKDDPRYEAIPRWEKDLYWIIPTDKWVAATPEDHAELMPEHLTKVVNGELQINKGVVYRVPKPHEFGVLFGSLPERLMEKYFKENPRAFKDFDETIMGVLSPSIVPDAAAPALEQWANKSMFTGRDLVPFTLEGVAPEYRFTDYTSESAKQLSKMTSWLAGPERAATPIMIDNYVRQWSGTMGQYALELSDTLLRKAGVTDGVDAEKSLADIPAIKAFVVRYPGANASHITDFYDRKKQVDQKMKTIKHLSKQIDMEDELESYMESTSGESMAQMNGTAKALTASRKTIQNINANPEISPKEKRQLIDGEYYKMIEAAKMAMQIADELDKQMAKAETRMTQGE
jgi:hypothetical protein